MLITRARVGPVMSGPLPVANGPRPPRCRQATVVRLATVKLRRAKIRPQASAQQSERIVKPLSVSLQRCEQSGLGSAPFHLAEAVLCGSPRGASAQRALR